MHPKAVDALVAGIQSFVDEFRRRRPEPERPPEIPPQVLKDATFTQGDVNKSHFYQGDRYTDFPNITPPEQTELQRLAASWHKVKEFPGTSLLGVENRLKILIVECLNGPDLVREYTLRLIDTLKPQPVTDILMPISGFDLEVDEWQLAPDVRLVRMTQERFEREVTTAYVAAANALPHLHDDPDRYGEAMALSLQDALVGRTVLIVRANGDEYVAEDDAQSRADLVVDLLQFLAGVFREDRWRVYIDWTGNVPASVWQRTGKIRVAGDVRPDNPGVRRGPLGVWRFGTPQLDGIKKYRLDEIIAMVLNTKPGPHEDMIQRAVRAFADGDRRISVDSKKLSYTTIFDIFFSQKGTENTARDIREGVSLTMCPDDEDLEDRFEQARFINDVYESRSRTSHEFETGTFDDDRLRLLREIAYHFIGVMARKGSFTKESLIEELAQNRIALGRRYDETLGKLSRPAPIALDTDAPEAT
jgi:hypothetical protein